MRGACACWGWMCILLPVTVAAHEPVTVSFVGGRNPGQVEVVSTEPLVITWPAGGARTGTAEFSLAKGTPLFRALGQRSAEGEQMILEHASPTFELLVGERKQNARGPHTFFDRVDERAYARVPLVFEPTAVRIASGENRTSVTFDSLQGEGFSGSLCCTFFAGTPLVHVEAVVSTELTDRAILFRGGLRAPREHVTSVVYHRAGDAPQRIPSPLTVPYRRWKLRTVDRGYGFGQPQFDPATSPLIGREDDGLLRARYRTVVMETPSGAVGVFPAPHKFLYPLDFADNVGFNYAWRHADQIEVGVRQPPLGDGRFRPWVDCPAGTQQRLDLFLFASTEDAAHVLAEVTRFTRDERYRPLEGFKTFTSHYHMWHTRELMRAQQQLGTDEIPAAFRRPRFVDKMKDTGMDIVHLAEFHGGPRTGRSRLEELQQLHSECARLSDDEILLLPGEEPNVHLGGHWVSFFPRPVYWDFVQRTTPNEVKQRIKRGQPPPFRREDPQLGTVYFVNSAADVQKLFELENGLYWTAHPRIKGSTGYPDEYRSKPYYLSPHFFGAAWKAMPADYSHERLGKRVLDLLDDMNQWGTPKQILGEADLFQLNPASELYGHANINYLVLPRVPRFEEGWEEVLNALRDRKYFTTTGEILVPAFDVNGQSFPRTVRPSDEGHLELTADVQGTFPLAYAEVVFGDGSQVHRRRLDLRRVGAFGSTKIVEQVPQRCDWFRLEIWDVAENGAFTQPVLVSRN